MVTEERTRKLGIIAGILAIITPILPWWMMFSDNYFYSWSIIDITTPYLLLGGITPILFLVFYYLEFTILMGGVITLLSIKSHQKIEASLGTILMVVPVIFLTIITIVFFTVIMRISPIFAEIVIFSFTADKIAFLGPGFFAGCVTSVLGIFYKRYFKKLYKSEPHNK
ncbi:MAG: hypothetical protein ACFFD2_13585 [Promethearchaeota archaeon]